ncbi:amidase family protein [Kribbella sp. VKM Ac-2568]|uniref:amidase family protein n=1 Tax=Kribbella sp. VKM Ac-2568 TaxID=2512219 RepID=UPI00104AF1D0|nr:amidase family protein [Kribbella sp. VKM Ac-2568]TCM44262.1 amidase [Kribbella sp. VKM Ac-2568]
MTEMEFWTAGEIASRIRDGAVSSREVTARLLERIAADSTVNAVVETRAEFALEAAAAADEAVAAGREVGPLHGVPMTVKDSFNVTGLHTTWGNPAFAEYVADWDATVVERLAAAGAIIVGKSNVPRMLADFGQTSNEVYGRTNNPHDPSRTPGGSSGGGAAALAAGMTYLEYGSDLVGSIRLPASYCGVYGLRPTAGVAPMHGFQPPGPPAIPTEFPDLSSLGPLARTAADLRIALQVTGGPTVPYSPELPYSWKLLPPRHKVLADYRVGVVLDHEQAPVTSGVGAALSDAVDALSKNGVEIVEGWPTEVDPIGQAEALGFQLGLFFAVNGENPDFASLADVLEQEHQRIAARVAWQRYFADVDVFLCPTSFTTAFPHDERPFEERAIDGTPYDAQAFWISQASLTGLPALSMPVATSGLPVGVQVIGPWHGDDTVITFAELAADVIGPVAG